MTVGLWCIFIAMLLPIIFAGIAKSGMSFKDNANPRDFKSTLTGWRQRAYWAELNSYEGFPAYAVAVLVAHIAKAPQDWINALAVGYILSRIIYGACYINDKATARSIAWMLGMLCVFGLYIISAMV